VLVENFLMLPHKALIADRRAFLRATAVTLAAGRFNMLRSWQEPQEHLERIALTSELEALSNATAWINSPALTAEMLKGKVVLVQFWTFTCINWLRTLPYIRAWAHAYKNSGLVVIGVHTPEFGFEHNLDNVRRGTAELKVDYPVAVDSNYAVWRGFNNQYWPALYLIDGKGRVRHHQFGEGEYPASERMIQQLLTEAGAREPAHQLVTIDGRGIEAAADWADLRSAENYVGYERTENFAAPGGAASGRQTYTVPRELRLNQWALAGDWTVEKGSIALNQPNGRIAYCFHGRDLHLVMGPPMGSRPVRFRVRLDGQPPNAAHGLEVDENGNGVATDQRLHQLIRQPKPIIDRVFEIEFLDSGVEAFSFTFG
jgi:thiol-disulfide isomerase/thioredoxin